MLSLLSRGKTWDWQTRLPDLSCTGPAPVVAQRTSSAKPTACLVLPSWFLQGGQTPGGAIREKGMMGHDKIKAAARRRMAETGEPYTLARRAVMEEHKAATAGQFVEPASPPSPPAEQPDAISEFSATADGFMEATTAGIARAIEQADKFHASVLKLTETERMATAGIARALEQAERFHAQVRKIGETERIALENFQRAVEQVNRVQETIERLGWI